MLLDADFTLPLAVRVRPGVERATGDGKSEPRNARNDTELHDGPAFLAARGSATYVPLGGARVEALCGAPRGERRSRHAHLRAHHAPIRALNARSTVRAAT